METGEGIRDGQFGRWLENARDWNIGRNRFWGAPVPVWKSDDPNYPRMDVYGSLDEIERDFGVRPTDLHRPYIDGLTRPNPDDPTGKSVMRRVEDVLDCWFESGSMPFAQLHYPVENRDVFEQNFPGDFIVEYVAQTRGWFYTLFVLSTALFDQPPFLSGVCHGVVLDENRQKLSKRFKNYPDPLAVFRTYGSDALRWYLMSSPIMSGGDLAMPKDGRAIAEAVRQAMLPLWNAYVFFSRYAHLDDAQPKLVSCAREELDRFILSRLASFVREVEEALGSYDTQRACRAWAQFVDVLNNWYIRRGRDHYWSDKASADKNDAYDVLYTVLVTVCRVLAPLLPFLTETIHRNLCDGASVHLEDWPDADRFESDASLVAMIERVREVCSLAASIRTSKSLRTRLPLRKLTIASRDSAMFVPFADLIADEANVKNVLFVEDPSLFGEMTISVDPRIGRKLGAKTKDVLAAARVGAWTSLEDGLIEIAGTILGKEDYQLGFAVAEDVDAATMAGGLGVVALDTKVDEDLEAEGCARDFSRAIQTIRRDRNFHVADRIEICVNASGDIRKALEAHKSHIQTETLASRLSFEAVMLDVPAESIELGVATVEVFIRVTGHDVSILATGI